jgi:hypothetical protein
MIESSRRHGHFDPRWKPSGKCSRGAPLERWEDEGGRYAVDSEPDLEVDCAERAPPVLNWDDFLARCIPRRGRHNLSALKSYEAEWQTSSTSQKC